MIKLDDKSYIVGVWFSSNPISNDNWLACIIRKPDNPKEHLGWYRFRYSKSADPFSGEDEKNWFQIGFNENMKEDDFIDVMNEAQARIEEGYPEQDCVIVKGDLKKLIELTKDKPWMHCMVKH
jgi:hypothetical protein